MHPLATDPDLSALRDRPAFKIPVSVLVVVYTAELDVLLLERADRPGWWQSVTGSMDPLDENPASTAWRELGEETGIVAGSNGVARAALVDWDRRDVYPILPAWQQRYAPGVHHNVEHVFGVCVPHGIAVTVAPAEHLQYRWLAWQDAAGACFSHTNAQAIRALPLRAGAAA